MVDIMKLKQWITVATFSLIAAPAFASTGNVNAFLGQKHLDSSDWSPVDDQIQIGIISDVRGDNWPISFAADLLVSGDKAKMAGPDILGSTLEFDFGVRKVFDIPNAAIHPYVGGGPALISARRELDYGSSTVSDSDSGAGYWVSGGIYWTFSEHYNAGIDLRHSKANVDLFGITRDAGGNHAGIMFGYKW